jgi:hypothetical protein
MDKKSLIDGDVTSRVEHAGPMLTAEMIRREFEQMKRLTVTIDAQSIVSGILPSVNGALDADFVVDGQGQSHQKENPHLAPSDPASDGRTGDRGQKHALGEGGG